MNCLVRPATPEDDPVLEQIERVSFSSGHWVAADFQGHDCTVVEYDGQVAGFVVIQQVYPGDSAAPPEFEILNVAVLPRFRRLGFARALLSQILRRRGVFFLEVRESNEPALRFYLTLGFREVARRPNYYNEPEETAIVMRAEQC